MYDENDIGPVACEDYEHACRDNGTRRALILSRMIFSIVVTAAGAGAARAEDLYRRIIRVLARGSRSRKHD